MAASKKLEKEGRENALRHGFVPPEDLQEN